MLTKTTTNTKEQDRCYDNCRTWWQQHTGRTLEPYRIENDRVYFIRNHVVQKLIDEMAQYNIIEHRVQSGLRRLHGPSAYATYRELVGRYGVQLTLHTTVNGIPPLVEMDFDYWNPWDVVGIIGHGVEVLKNKFKGTRTDPFKVAKARGYID